MSTTQNSSNKKWYVIAIAAALAALTVVYKQCGSESSNGNLPGDGGNGVPTQPADPQPHNPS